MTKNFDLAIVGGGIAGVSLAVALHHRGINVTIYESARAFGEIGAGVAFGPNAQRAMKVCHKGIYEGWERVRTRNIWPSKKLVWFDYIDAYGDGDEDNDDDDDNGESDEKARKIAFTITNEVGQGGLHRAHFLAELVKLLPEGIAQFKKRVTSVTDPLAEKREDNGSSDNKKLVIHFTDGTSAEADAVIGCDGIKSAVRRHIVGEDSPSAWPSFTHQIAYRGLIPMQDAIAAVGKEIAENSFMHMGPGGHLLTFPVNHGKLVNLVAFKSTPEDWDDPTQMTKPTTQETLLQAYAGYKPYIQKLLKLTNPALDIWAIFDLGDNPAPIFYKGRVCVAGDAAHATSPHHGAGGGFCIEDSAVLASLLADERVTSVDHLEAVFAAFDASRRERSQWLVQSSRFIADCYQWRAEGVGRDFTKIEDEINKRLAIISDFDIEAACALAREDLAQRLG